MSNEIATITVRGYSDSDKLDISVALSPAPVDGKLPDSPVGRAIALMINAIKEEAEDDQPDGGGCAEEGVGEPEEGKESKEAQDILG